MFESIDQLVDNLNLKVSEWITLPERAEHRSSAPTVISTGPAADALTSINADGMLWNHQSLALEYLCAGDNVVVATGTASGKSLIFQLYALHRLLTDQNSKVLVFYPLRALTADQLVSWKRIVQSVGLPPEAVDLIYGGVPMERREQILEQARVVLMTPDVCQAWFMRSIGTAPVRRFLEGLTLLILDEAHVYESVFGSNTAFLLRRLLAAKRQIIPQPHRGNQNQLQMVAATATIADAEQHLEGLTGLSFQVVDEDSNGAPTHPRRVLHIEGPDHGADGETAIASILSGICSLEQRHRFIAFMDSRQGVERIARTVGTESVKAYRSGFEASDRAEIERSLRNGALRGVVSTSALELGIDIADMEIGVNLGVPDSRKRFRQRLGRIGRSQPGVFIVVAPSNAFKQFGESLQDYYDGSIEPSYLYLGNDFVQFAHARCLRDEMELIGRESSGAPGGARWPEKFSEILGFAREGWPRQFDPVAQIGGGSPHINYPLRQIVDPNFSLTSGRSGFEREIGNIAHHQAIREAYPGGNYLHAGRAYRVSRWAYGFGEETIRLDEARNAVRTRPILRKVITVDLSRDGIVDGRIKKSQSGLVAEVQIQVNESVEGYQIGNSQYRYRDLRVDNPNMRRQQRDFRTTGIIVQIEDEWFSHASVRGEIADALRELLCRDRSIAPHDIDATHTNIAIRTASGRQHVTDAVVVYDSVYGGLRLSENLFTEFERYTDQLGRAVDLAGSDAIVNAEAVELLQSWVQGLADTDAGSIGAVNINVPDGWLLVFKPGSVVGVFINPSFVERELIEPVYRDFFGTGEPQLYYSYRTGGEQVSFTPHEGIEAVGQDWELILWNPNTGAYQALDELEG